MLEGDADEGIGDILEGTVRTAVGASMGNGSLKIGADATVSPKARISGPALAGASCAIDANRSKSMIRG